MDIRAILIDKHGYSPREAEILEKDLSALDNRLSTIWESWEQTGKENDSQSFHGYSIDSLRDGYGMNFFAALVTLDWVLKDPDNAIPAIKQGIL